jgi:hypothetical protein
LTHRDDFDDEDDHFGDWPPPRPRQGTSPIVVILIILGAVALLGLAVRGGLFGWMGMRVEAPPQPAALDAATIQPAGVKEGTRRVYTPGEFVQFLRDKTPEEVIAAVGRPDSASTNTDGTPRKWEYRDCIHEPSTGRVSSGLVSFNNGKVWMIDFVAAGH